MESINGLQEEDPPLGTSICLVCATIVVKVEQEEEEEVETTRQVVDPVVIWNYFLRTFRIRQNRERYRWDLSRELVPLCGACKEELSPLLELQREVDKLMGMIQGGIAELKDKWRRSEEAFKANGVYQEDERFYFTRAFVLGNEVVGKNPRDKLTQCVKHQRHLGRRVPRRQKRRRSEEVKQARVNKLKTKKKVKVSDKSVETSTKKKGSTDDDDEFPEGYFIFSEDHPSPPPPPAETEPPASVVSPRRPFTPPPKSEEKGTRHWDESKNCDTGDNGYGDGAGDGDSDWNKDNEISISGGSCRQSSRRKRARASAITRERIRKSLRDEEDVEVPIPKQRRNKDEDYIPHKPISSDVEEAEVGSDSDSQEKEEDDADADLDDNVAAVGKIAKRASFDPQTGDFRFLHVTMEKVVVEEEGEEEENKFKCRLCSELVLNKGRQSLRDHVLWKHTNRTKCKHCGKVKPTLVALKSHIKFVHTGPGGRGARVYKKGPCPICGKPVRSKWSRMWAHMWTHYSEQDKQASIAKGEGPPSHLSRKFQCETCGLHVSSPTALRNHHAALHSGGTKVRKEKQLCPKCGKSYAYLELHIQKVHDAKDPGVWKQFVCSICDKVFGTLYSLLTHKPTHDKRFSCGVCGRMYAHEFQLQKHLKDKHHPVTT